jgi:hypothetical protein
MNEQYAKHPFNEWLKGQAGNTTAPSAARVENAVPSPLPAPSGSATIAPTIDWKPGYQWTYRYESARDSGIFAWIVNREEMVDGIAFYVVAAGSREIYFRKSDFAHYMEKVNGAVVVRNNPPIRLASGTVGDKWELRYVRETPQLKQNLVRTCEAAGPETITVPAGKFETVKTTCVDARTGEPVFEIWYSAAAKQMVRDRTRFSYGWSERELIGLRLYPDRVQ